MKNQEKEFGSSNVQNFERTFNQIITCLNQIISENKPYNLRLCTFTFHILLTRSIYRNNTTKCVLKRYLIIFKACFHNDFK